MAIHYEAWCTVANQNGFKLDKDLYLSMAGIPANKVTQTINEQYHLSLDPKSISRQKGLAFLELVRDHPITEIKSVVNIVRKYHGVLPMAIGTGSRRSIAKIVIQSLCLEDYIPILVAADDVMRHKPFPDTFMKCAEMMDIPYENCMVFEDGNPGLEAAKTAGMTPVDVRLFNH